VVAFDLDRLTEATMGTGTKVRKIVERILRDYETDLQKMQDEGRLTWSAFYDRFVLALDRDLSNEVDRAFAAGDTILWSTLQRYRPELFQRLIEKAEPFNLRPGPEDLAEALFNDTDE
jgi:hypothetical protein